jgi:hypothetical protein
MEAIYGGSLATGIYAMGSNEPLGTDMGPVDAQMDEVKSDLASPEVLSGKGMESNAGSSKGSNEKEKVGKKRKLGSDEMEMMGGMIKAVESVGQALRTPQHNEVHAELLWMCHGLPWLHPRGPDVWSCVPAQEQGGGTVLFSDE